MGKQRPGKQKRLCLSTQSFCFLRLQKTFQPDDADAERIVKSVLLTLLQNVGRVLGVDYLDQDLSGNLRVVLFLIRHDLKNEITFLTQIAVANGVAFPDERSSEVFKVFAGYLGTLFFCHADSSCSPTMGIIL